MLDGSDPWWRDGICAQIGPDLFFLNFGEPGTEAKRACAMCPVRLQCLIDALDGDVEAGIFGGFGRDDRRRMTNRIGAGEDPFEVAVAAIENEERERVRRAEDHRRPAPTRRRRNRLCPSPA